VPGAFGKCQPRPSHTFFYYINYKFTSTVPDTLGFIACKDGFTATTFTPDQFRSLAADLPASFTLAEVDGSSLFCILRKSGPGG
jgi:hypothetical protein